ncbi:hypothetical protein [Bremerella sp.]|uniref:hypothetical protein n=1 Tax=Bremerella sp. TaxID=2795602 RepID=UPI00391B486F
MPRFLRQFGLRTLLIFCTIAAICFGLWRWHMTWVDGQREIAAQIADAGGSTRWKTWGPQWMHKAFGSYYFSDIVAVDLNHKRLQSKHLQLLRQIPTLEELYLPGVSTQGDSLAVLEDLPKIRKLALWNTRLGNDTLKHVGKLKNLETLDTHRTEMTEEGLVHLRNHPRLEVLRYNMPIGKVGVDHLSTMKNLKLTHLTLQGGTEESFRHVRDHFQVLVLNVVSPKTDQWAKYLAGHPTLVQLSVTDAPVQNDQFARLLSENTLQIIEVNDVPIDDTALASAVDASELKRFSLRDTNVTATGLLTHLGPSVSDLQIMDRWIKLTDTSAKREIAWSGDLANEDLAALVYCPKLTSLNLFSVNFPGVIDFTFFPELTSLSHVRMSAKDKQPKLEHLDSLTKLESFVLYPVRGVTVQELAEMAKIKSLKRLELPQASLSDEHLKVICSITQLKQLIIQGAKVTDEGMKSIVELENLEHLDLAKSRRITDQSLEYVSQLKQLRRLNISETNITDGGLRHLYNMPKLFDVNVAGTKYSPEGFHLLYQSLPVSDAHLEQHAH